MTATTPPLRVGIAGGGERGAKLVAALRQEPRARVAAVYDPFESARQRFAQEHGIEGVCATFAELLEQVDMVILISPMQHHTPQACEALARGVHVLSEVPAAVSIEQAGELVAAVRSSEALYGMAENYIYFLPNLVVDRMIKAGEIGQPYYAESDALADMAPFFKRPDGSETWQAHWWVGRDGHTYPTHSLGPLLGWLDDRLVAVSCVGAGRYTEHELQDTTVLLGRTVRGHLLRLRFSWLSKRPCATHCFAVQGTEGAYDQGDPARGDSPAIHLSGRTPPRMFDGFDVGGWEPLEPFAERFLPSRYELAADFATASDPGRREAWLQQDVWLLQDFLDSVLADRPLDIGVHTALDMTLPGIVAERSIAQGGTWVDVPNSRFFTAGIGSEPGRESPRA